MYQNSKIDMTEGIATFDNVFLRNEELIELVEKSNTWKEINGVKVHNLDTNTELHTELVKTFVYYINEYGKSYPQLKVSGAETLIVIKYEKGDSYGQHIDSFDGKRVISGILFLNGDIKGGEEVFPHQKLEIQPGNGRLALFPSTYTHIHQTNEVLEGTCYVVKAWFK